MRQISESDLIANIHPSVVDALNRWRETGVLDWTPPPGTPHPPSPPTCPVCHDVGEVAIREPGAFTRYAPCASCTTRVDRIRERLVAKVPPEYRRSFDETLRAAPTRDLQEIVVGMQAWAENGEGSVLLTGPEGTLKTTLAGAAYLYRVEHDMLHAAEWWSLPNLLDEIRRAFDHEVRIPLEAEAVERAKRCELLVLDDLGVSAITDRNAPWVHEKLYQVLDHRVGYRLPTIMTSNLSTEQLKIQLNPALVSRIVGLCHANIAITRGTDIRYAEGRE